MTQLTEIEEKAKTYSKARTRLAQLIIMVNETINQVKRKHIPDIKKLVNDAVAAHAELAALLEKYPALFVKPRTVIFHGVKVGYAKQKGRIEIADEEKTILLIRKHLADQADLLIATKETVSKDALGNVSVADLKRIGCNVVADTDAVVIKPTDSEVDKVVAALLKEAEAV